MDTYTLYEVIINPRDGESQFLAFEVYESKAEALKAARRELKGRRWAVTQERVVATSKEPVIAGE